MFRISGGVPKISILQNEANFSLRLCSKVPTQPTQQRYGCGLFSDRVHEVAHSSRNERRQLSVIGEMKKSIAVRSPLMIRTSAGMPG
jgi:hypothetical protein